MKKILSAVCVEVVVPRISTLRVQEEKPVIKPVVTPVVAPVEAPRIKSAVAPVAKPVVDVVCIKTREPVEVDRPVKIQQNRKSLDLDPLREATTNVPRKKAKKASTPIRNRISKLEKSSSK